MGLDPAEATGLFHLLDIESEGSVSINRFVMGCLRIRGGAKAVDVLTLLYENKRLTTSWTNAAAKIREDFDRVNRILEAISSEKHADGRRPLA